MGFESGEIRVGGREELQREGARPWERKLLAGGRRWGVLLSADAPG